MDGSIVWFRQDLRLADQPALQAALDRGGPILPVFIWEPNEEGPWAPASASRWWLHQSLRSLEADLHKHKSRLVIRQGPALATLEALLEETGATAVFWNRRYEPLVIERDKKIKAALKTKGVVCESFGGNLLFEPAQVHNKQGQPFQVFTPFWRAVTTHFWPSEEIPAPKTLPSPRFWPDSIPLAKLHLEPTIDWASGMRKHWTPGESGAQHQLQAFLHQAVNQYADDRDRPDLPGTSALSPHLHFGEISPWQIWHAAARNLHVKPGDAWPRGAEVFLREIGWREFAHHLLYHFPATTDQPLRPEFAAFPWQHNPVFLRAWQRGRTGYPLVDAGMRQLWALGWMHNRVRMVVASFLVKDLLQSWVEGARWFWDTLVDADLASNTLGWQWTAGCGADAAPYFRVFNPVTQSEKFDPTGAYIRRWVPELERLPQPWIFRPWDAPREVLATAGVTLGQTYPTPIVDHAQARATALAAFAGLQRSSP